MPYLDGMESHLQNVAGHFIERAHTMHHKCRVYNGTLSDMAIETIYKPYHHCHYGTIGLTLKSETLKASVFLSAILSSVVR